MLDRRRGAICIQSIHNRRFMNGHFRKQSRELSCYMVRMVFFLPRRSARLYSPSHLKQRLPRDEKQGDEWEVRETFQRIDDSLFQNGDDGDPKKVQGNIERRQRATKKCAKPTSTSYLKMRFIFRIKHANGHLGTTLCFI